MSKLITLRYKKVVLKLVGLMLIINTVIMSGCGTEEKTTEYILPEMITTATGQTQDSAIEELEPQGNKDDLVTSIRKGGRGSIIVEITDKQRDRWLDDIEKTIKQCKEDAEELGCKIIVNDERTETTYKLNGNADMQQFAKITMQVTSRCMQYQVFNGTSPDKIKLQRTIINIETGKVMGSVSLDEEFTINPEDWEE